MLKLGIVIVTLGFLISCNNSNSRVESKLNLKNIQTMLIAEQIKIGGLKNALIKLQNGKTEFDFIGITSNGIDCIYFMMDKGKFNIDFEIIKENQKPFLIKLKNYAISKDYKFILTTYNNKPEYESTEPAPVIRIETNSTLEQITEIGTNIQRIVFNNDENTVYEVVP
jgi:hypothetical protein